MIGRKRPSNLVNSPPSSSSPQASESQSQAVTPMMYESASGKPLPEPKSSWVFNLSWILNLLTMFAGGLGVLVNIISLFRVAQSPMQVLTRFFALNLCLLVILTEFESPRFFSWFGIMESWIGRGMGSIFAGALLSILHNDPNSEDSDSFLWIIVQVSSIYLIIVGSLYCFFGALCLKALKEHKLQLLQRREHIKHEKHELEMKRNEIDNLLQETELKLQRSLV